MLSREEVQADPWKLCVLTEITPPIKNTAILGIMNYLGKFLSSTTQVCETLGKVR